MSLLSEGDLIDEKYRIVRFIGRGGWASVYEGVNHRIGRRVAIKVLSAEAAEKPGVLERFEREAQAATRIESEHVVHVFDFGQLPDGRAYIVMELLDGVNLGAQISAGTVSQGRAVFYTVQALQGLADAHAAGVTHRDIKPENIVVVKKQGHELVKIVDFGISKLQSGLSQGEGASVTQTNTVLGSPVYMSPEQCRGTRHMDHRSDLYSLGVVLFELLTGALPHKGDTFNELMFKIALEDAIDPALLRPDLEPALCEIVRKSLRRSADERFQSAVEFELALLEWADDQGLGTSSWRGQRQTHVDDEPASNSARAGAKAARVPIPIELAQTRASSGIDERPPKHTPSARAVVRTDYTPSGETLGDEPETVVEELPFQSTNAIHPPRRLWIAGLAGGAVAFVAIVLGAPRLARTPSGDARGAAWPADPPSAVVAPLPGPSPTVVQTATPPVASGEAPTTDGAPSRSSVIPSARTPSTARPTGAAHVPTVPKPVPVLSTPSAAATTAPAPSSSANVVGGRRIRTDTDF